MKPLHRYFSLLVLVLFSGFYAGSPDTAAQTDQSTRVVGDLRLHSFTSKIFGNTRTLRVLLPPGYDQPKNRNRRYPVLYLNDGQNLFDASTSVFNPMEWRVDEAVQNLIASEEIQPLIIVGIDNAGRSVRANEYLPYPDAYLSPPLPNPQGSRYPDFLTGEVMPLIEGRYRIRKGAEHTGLGGSSYGALISLYTVINKPGIFGRVLLESPSFYVSEGRIIRESRAIRRWPKRVYLGVGTNEDGVADCKPGDRRQDAVRDVLRLEQILKSARGVWVNTVVEDCSIHNEDAWAKRFPEALKFLYRK